ncbi:TonB family protein, partial [Kaistia terrae]
MSRGARIGETLLWASAGLVVLTAHVGAAAWLLRDEPMAAADASPPPAILIELAPEPEAVVTEKTEISPDPELAAEIAPNMAEPIDQPTPEELQPVEEKVVEAVQPEDVVDEVTEPVEEITEVEPVVDEIEPVEDEIVTELETVAVPLPAPRPKPPVRKLVEKAEPKPPREQARKPPRQAPSASSKASVEAAAQVKQADRTAARQSTSGLFSSSVTPAKWQSRLMAHLERRKRYPAGSRSRGETGIVTVRFTIDDGGNVLAVALAGSSGFP